MDRPYNEQPARERVPLRWRWLWIAAAIAVAAALAGGYLYQKSLEDDLEAMLRAALQQYRAESAESAPQAGAPDPDAGSDPR